MVFVLHTAPHALSLQLVTERMISAQFKAVNTQSGCHTCLRIASSLSA